MFEDSLMESAGRIRTRSKWFAMASFGGQVLVLGALILAPIVHPEALPRQALRRLLMAPEVPRAAAVEVHRASAPRQGVSLSLEDALRAPRAIPTQIATVHDDASNWSPGGNPLGGPGVGDAGGMPDGLAHSAPAPVVRQAQTRQPLKVSAGVAAGQLLRPIRPAYPAVAVATRTEGTVVVEARISKSGAIEDLRVVSGPALLRQAALDAISAARYRPFLLNGEPVEVDATIRVIFSLGG